ERIGAAGDFNATLPFSALNTGENSLTLTALLEGGSQLVKEVTVDYVPGNVWPLPYSVDFTDDSLTQLADVVQVVDGWWAFADQGVRTQQVAFDRLLAAGDASWTEYEAVAEIIIHDVALTTNPAGFGLGARWQGHVGGGSPPTTWWPMGCIGMYRYKSPAKFDMFDSDSQVRNSTNAPVVTLDTSYF